MNNLYLKTIDSSNLIRVDGITDARMLKVKVNGVYNLLYQLCDVIDGTVNKNTYNIFVDHYPMQLMGFGIKLLFNADTSQFAVNIIQLSTIGQVSAPEHGAFINFGSIMIGDIELNIDNGSTTATPEEIAAAKLLLDSDQKTITITIDGQYTVISG